MDLEQELKSIDILQQPLNSFTSTLYRCKIITAGGKQQVFNYSKPMFKDFMVDRPKSEKRMEGDKRDDNLHRTRNNLVLLIDSNVTPYSKFMTLTFRHTMLDRKEAYEKFKQFQKDFKKKFGYPFQYVAVIEHQTKRGQKEDNEGSLHFHCVVFNERKLPFKALKSIWGKYGSVDIKKIDTIQNLGRYMAKYLTKETMKLNNKGYTSSRNLKKPDVEYLPYNLEVYDSPHYQNTYTLYTGNSEETSECTFSEYRKEVYTDPFLVYSREMFKNKVTICRNSTDKPC